jgi:hypothetical protein
VYIVGPQLTSYEKEAKFVGRGLRVRKKKRKGWRGSGLRLLLPSRVRPRLASRAAHDRGFTSGFEPVAVVRLHLTAATYPEAGLLPCRAIVTESCATATAAQAAVIRDFNISRVKEDATTFRSSTARFEQETQMFGTNNEFNR